MARVIPIDGKESSDTISLPGPKDRITITGHTGSGKSQAAMWHLSNANFDAQPWVIHDPKGEEKINAIDGAEYIGLDDKKLPTYPGLYILQTTQYDNDALDDWFSRALSHRHIGVYCDEGYLCGFGPGFTTMLIQGRSKYCPMIVLNQRPVIISRFAFSEAQYFQCFALTDDRDVTTLRGFAKVPDFAKQPIPEFWSYYYDVRKKRSYKMRPVPRIEDTLNRIQEKLDAREPRRRYL
jgi:hypothetical protein